MRCVSERPSPVEVPEHQHIALPCCVKHLAEDSPIDPLPAAHLLIASGIPSRCERINLQRHLLVRGTTRVPDFHRHLSTQAATRYAPSASRLLPPGGEPTERRGHR